MIKTQATTYVSYANYCYALDLCLDVQVAALLPAWLTQLKDWAVSLAKRAGASVVEVLDAFKNKTVYSLLSAVRFDVRKLLSALRQASSVLHTGLLALCKKLVQTRAFQALRKGTLTVDEFLNAHPLLKKVSSVALAGIMIYVWLNMPYIGNFEYDMDMSDITNALLGKFTISDLLTTDAGIEMLVLLGASLATGVSFPWLFKEPVNVFIAIMYTVYKETGRPKFAARFRNVLR